VKRSRQSVGFPFMQNWVSQYLRSVIGIDHAFLLYNLITQKFKREFKININKINKKIMHQELEKTVDSVLANGELTDRSRELLMKKAEQLGVDLIDFELELESKIAQKKASTSGPLPIYTTSNLSNKEGDLKKCPSCGAPVESFTTKCADCGHEFRNIESSQSVQKLFEMLNDLEKTRKEDETNPLKAFGGTFSKALSGQNMYGGGKIDNQRKELIRNFPIPNTKEDILEFLSMSVPKAKKIGNAFSKFSNSGFEVIAHNDMVPVWKSKCEQIIIKARFSMKEDKSTLAQIEAYAKELGIK